MNVEAREDLDDWLLIWWMAERRAGLAPLGLPRECPSTRGYRSTAIWASDHGDDDAHDRAGLVRLVGAAVAALQPAHRAAVHAHARNLAAGATVWRSARAGSEDAAAAVLVLTAALESLHRGLRVAA